MNTKYLLLVLVSFEMVFVAGCNNGVNFANSKGPSASEQNVLGGNPFGGNPGDGGGDTGPTGQPLTDIDDANDALIPNLKPIFEDPKFIALCDPISRDGINRYEAEKQAALAAARADKTLIPVKFSISVGRAVDQLAYWAHLRSILRVDSNMVTPVYVGPAIKDGSDDAYAFTYGRPGDHFHYLADHSQARQHFIDGTNCFFDVIKVKGFVDDTGKQFDLKGGVGTLPDAVAEKEHHLRNLYYGNDYDADHQMDAHRLFKKLDEPGDPNFVNLFIADIRDGGLNTSASDKIPLLSAKFVDITTRGMEYQQTFRQIFQLRNMWTYRDQLTKILSTSRNVQADTGLVIPDSKMTSSDFKYSGYVAGPQLIEWIVRSGLSATETSTQYTPLVLDLGDPNIKTSSLDWGTFFNLANISLQMPNANDLAPAITHLTAWLGGSLVQIDEKNSISDTVMKRRADDGFLVIPNADGSVSSGKNLFGSSMTIKVGEQQKTFANGFDALAALASKDCTSTDIKKRYFGPWDGDLFTKTVKVWVDTDRNGVADAGELLSLENARVGAINACFIISKKDKDRFGNATSMRSAFLYMNKGEKVVGNEEEILRRLNLGKTSDGNDATFRVVIDILFKTDTKFVLEDVDNSKISVPNTSLVSGLKISARGPEVFK